MPDYATLLRDHVTLKVRWIDRIFLQGCVHQLQSVGQVCTFLRWRRGFRIPSSVAFGRIGEQCVKDIQSFAEDHRVPLVHFEKGESEEERVRPLLQQTAKDGGDRRVVLIGVAQEKASAWRSWRAKGQEKAAHPHMEWDRQMTHLNHFYFYLWDPEWGPAFWKTNAYGPFPIWLWLNGHEWAKRQMEKADVPYQALDDGSLSCADPAFLQKRWDQLGSGAVRDFFWRWYWRLPSPFTKEDLDAGYEPAFRQFEVSDTSLKLFTGGNALAVVAGDAVRLLDAAANKKGEELTLPGADRASLVFSGTAATPWPREARPLTASTA